MNTGPGTMGRVARKAPASGPPRSAATVTAMTTSAVRPAFSASKIQNIMSGVMARLQRNTSGAGKTAAHMAPCMAGGKGRRRGQTGR